MTYKKKLIEVSLPLNEINEACIKEKSIRHGHPSTIHLWWARRPLAACRAVLFSSLVDDPSNYLPEKEANKERKRLFKLISDLVLWENTDNNIILQRAQKEIEKSVGNNLPAVLDPFCGGGSIPLEAQRLGLPSFASDLNPIPVIITKSLIEIPTIFSGKPPVSSNKQQKGLGIKTDYKCAQGLAIDIEFYGRWMNDEVIKRIGKFFPDVEGKKVIAWLWSRTVKCPNPACNVEVPLVRTFKLSRKENKYITPIYADSNKRLEFNVTTKKFDLEGTTSRKGVICPNCRSTFSLDYVRKEGKQKRMYQKLSAIVVEGNKGQEFISPIEEHTSIAMDIKPLWVPETELVGKATVSVPLYGMSKHGDLFTNRQLLALNSFSDMISEVKELIYNEAKKAGFKDDNIGLEEGGNGAKAYSEAIATYLSLAVGRCANYWSSLTPWGGSFIVQTFGRQAIPMVWDFAEGNPFSNSTGNWLGAINWIVLCIKKSVPARGVGKVMQLDATKTLFPGIRPVICTDPPYYDNICYADLSDYFYIWLRKSLKTVYPKLFSTVLTPKANELIASPFTFKGNPKEANKYFITGFKRSFELFREFASKDFPITFFYAFMQSEEETDSIGEKQYSSTGWETMLDALISSELVITATWPIRTERDQGLKTGDNVLSSSIVLACRPRSDSAPLATRRDFSNILKKELRPALKNIQDAGIAPVDLAQSAIGPGMAVFSRYSKVLEADGNPMSVRTALQIINQELDSYLTEQESEMDKETRFCVAWYEQFGWKDGPFGDANTLATAKGTAVNALESVIYAKAGKVRLLKRNELTEDWDPTNDRRLTVWECIQYLIDKLEQKGESGAANIIRKIGGLAEPVKELSYRLYSLCMKKGWTEDALAYNSLISSWQSIVDKAQSAEHVSEETKRALKDKSQKTLIDL